MNTALLRRPATLAVLTGGLALAAVTMTAPLAAAGEPETAGAHNEHISLVNETDAQPEEKSRINGTAQVASYDGSSVVFSTPAALVPWDDNGTDDVYLRSRPDGFTILVSGTTDGAGDDASFEPTISDDGRWVAYSTFSTDLAKGTGGKALDVVVRDMATGTTTLVSQTSAGRVGKRNSFFPVISGNGRHVSFQSFARLGPKDEDKTEDVYVRNLRSGSTQQVSLLPGADRDVRGAVVNGDISDNGRLVTFGNDQSLWVRDMVAGATTRFHHEPSPAPCNDVPSGSAGRPAISGNGRYVAFTSCAEDLVGKGGAADLFRVALGSGRIERLTEGDGHSYHPGLSRTGRFVSFGSDASNLVAGDTEGFPDVFREDVGTGEVVRVSQAPDGSGGDSWSGTNAVAISGDGHTVVYQSYSHNLVPDDQYDLEESYAWFDH